MRNLVVILYISTLFFYGVFAPEKAYGDDKVSKANAYTVVGPVSGNVSISKANAYTVLVPVNGKISVSKANAYSVIAPVSGNVSISKAIAYAVIAPPSVQKQPSIFIMTQNKIKNSPPLTLNSVESLSFDLNSLIFTSHQN